MSEDEDGKKEPDIFLKVCLKISDKYSFCMSFNENFSCCAVRVV